MYIYIYMNLGLVRVYIYIYHHCVTSNPQSYFKIVIKVEIPFRQRSARYEDHRSRFGTLASRTNFFPAKIFLFLTTSVSSHNELNTLDTPQTHAFKAS